MEVGHYSTVDIADWTDVCERPTHVLACPYMQHFLHSETKSLNAPISWGLTCVLGINDELPQSFRGAHLLHILLHCDLNPSLN